MSYGMSAGDNNYQLKHQSNFYDFTYCFCLTSIVYKPVLIFKVRLLIDFMSTHI